MSEDIRAGDVVVCVASQFSTCKAHRTNAQSLRSGVLVAGRTYKVSRLTYGDFGACGSVAVALAGVVSPLTPVGFCPGCLRKIEAPKTELSERIRACRPIKEEAHV